MKQAPATALVVAVRNVFDSELFFFTRQRNEYARPVMPCHAHRPCCGLRTVCSIGVPRDRVFDAAHRRHVRPVEFFGHRLGLLAPSFDGAEGELRILRFCANEVDQVWPVRHERSRGVDEQPRVERDARQALKKAYRGATSACTEGRHFPHAASSA